ncbi:MAG: class I SAM-dependent methyltransferase [Pseudomonadota bacterium]|nr:class I SAM-dependent methyltransferase [Pseudomonadota bacterium]
MSHEPLKALSWALPEDLSGKSVLFVGAQPLSGLSEADVTYLQGFYPFVQALERQGASVACDWPNGEMYDVVLLLAPQNLLAMQYQLAQSLLRLADDGILIAVAANDAGGKRLGKLLKSAGVAYDEESKEKCRIVFASKDSADPSVIQDWITQGSVQPILDGAYMSQPGIYGWDKLDKGSALLAEHLPEKLKGTGADFGCGYGYLAQQVLTRYENIKTLYCIEADHNALACAKENLSDYTDKTEFIWADLTAFTARLKTLDWVVMNPPFHEGKAADSEIGKAFISTAHRLMRKNAQLYMVANTHLPYEAHLQDTFFKVEKAAEGSGFKVFICTK